MAGIKHKVQFLKYRLKDLFPKNLWGAMGAIRRKFLNFQYMERGVRRRRLGSEAIYIIRRQPPGAGLFSNVNHVLQGIIRADELQRTPVVDMQNYWTWYSSSRKFLGTYNAWEYFFEPLSEKNLEKLNRGCEVTLSKGDRILGNHWLASLGLEFVEDEAKITYLHELWVRNIRVNEFISKVLFETKQKLAWDAGRTLAVSYRGTEYNTVKPAGHAIQPEVNVLLADLPEIIKQTQLTRIFLSSEDAELRKSLHLLGVDFIIEDFRSSQWFYESLCRHSNQQIIPWEIVKSAGYLVEIILLSECNSFVGSIANGSAAAIIMNGNQYSKKQIYNLGVY